MPTLPTLTLNATEIDIQEVYEDSLCDPTVALGGTLDMLNGGLDSDNYGGTAPPWSVQPGAFMRAVTVPFERWEFVYAKQLSTDENADNHVVIGALSYRLFLPWDAACVMVNWQALWRHDAGLLKGLSTLEENWKAKFYLGGDSVDGLQLTLSPSRWGLAAAAGGSATFADLGMANEQRWPYVARTVVARHNDATYPNFCDKGFRTVMVKVFASMKHESDAQAPKLLIPSGAVNIIAVRR